MGSLCQLCDEYLSVLLCVSRSLSARQIEVIFSQLSPVLEVGPIVPSLFSRSCVLFFLFLLSNGIDSPPLWCVCLLLGSYQNKLFEVVRHLLVDYVHCCNGQFSENWNAMLLTEDTANDSSRKYQLMVVALVLPCSISLLVVFTHSSRI